VAVHSVLNFTFVLNLLLVRHLKTHMDSPQPSTTLENVALVAQTSQNLVAVPVVFYVIKTVELFGDEVFNVC